MCVWGISSASLRFEKDLGIIYSSRGFIDKFSLFLSLSEALVISCLRIGGGGLEF